MRVLLKIISISERCGVEGMTIDLLEAVLLKHSACSVVFAGKHKQQLKGAEVHDAVCGVDGGR